MLRSPLTALAAGFLLLGGIVASIAFFASNVQTTSDALTHALERNLMLSTLMSRVQGAETGQRGYLLTGDDAYLDNHAAATASVETSMTAISTATEDGFSFLPENVTRLKAAVDAKMSELRETIAMAKSGRRDEAIAVVDTDRGEELMTTIRDVANDMRMRNTTRLNAEISRERTAVTRLWAGISTAVVGIVDSCAASRARHASSSGVA